MNTHGLRWFLDRSPIILLFPYMGKKTFDGTTRVPIFRNVATINAIISGSISCPKLVSGIGTVVVKNGMTPTYTMIVSRGAIPSRK